MNQATSRKMSLDFILVSPPNLAVSVFALVVRHANHPRSIRFRQLVLNFIEDLSLSVVLLLA